MLNNIDGLLLDFSGTLFDYRPVIQPKKLYRLTKQPAIGFDEITVQSFCERILKHADSEIGRKHRLHCDLSHEQHETAWKTICQEAIGNEHERFIALFFQALIEPENWPPFSDTLSFLQSLKNYHKKICVVSNIAWDIRKAFQLNKLDRFIDQFILSYEIGLAKPNEKFFDLACKSINCNKKRALMIGDDKQADNAEPFGIQTIILPPLIDGLSKRGFSSYW